MIKEADSAVPTFWSFVRARRNLFELKRGA
jgi:hypothetical protein